jgi:hypothetical protein
MYNNEQILNLFEYFTRKICNYDLKWKKNFSEKDLKIVENCKLSTDFYFLWNYFIFQYKGWSEKIEHQSFKGNNGKIDLSYIIGKKAIERYELRNQEFDGMIFNTKFQKTYNITKYEFNEIYNKSNENKKYNIETEYKKKFYNTDKGIILCNTYTIGYNSNIYCQICKNKKICKEIIE